jgi:hypothetical protein
VALAPAFVYGDGAGTSEASGLATRSASYKGPAREADEESAALVIWQCGLKGLGWRAEEVADRKLSDPHKEALAGLLKPQTTRRNEWIAANPRRGVET